MNSALETGVLSLDKAAAVPPQQIVDLVRSQFTLREEVKTPP